jgi:hypothetical protein
MVPLELLVYQDQLELLVVRDLQANQVFKAQLDLKVQLGQQAMPVYKGQLGKLVHRELLVCKDLLVLLASREKMDRLDHKDHVVTLAQWEPRVLLDRQVQADQWGPLVQRDLQVQKEIGDQSGRLDSREQVA